jgi:hypothetical protein
MSDDIDVLGLRAETAAARVRRRERNQAESDVLASRKSIGNPHVPAQAVHVNVP